MVSEIQDPIDRETYARYSAAMIAQNRVSRIDTFGNFLHLLFREALTENVVHHRETASPQEQMLNAVYNFGVDGEWF